MPRDARNRTARGLVLLGLFCAVASAWGTLSVHGRSRSDDVDTKVQTKAPAPSAGPSTADRAADRHESAPRVRPIGRAANATGAPTDVVADTSDAGTRHRQASAQERQERVANARHELEFLENQDPAHFLAIFEVMKTDGRWDNRKLEAARNESHAYIIARTRLLERMLHRFIDDPDSDHTLEIDALAHLDLDFKEKLDGFARDIPPVANLQDLLTTTTLKTPGFTEAPAEPE